MEKVPVTLRLANVLFPSVEVHSESSEDSPITINLRAEKGFKPDSPRTFIIRLSLEVEAQNHSLKVKVVCVGQFECSVDLDESLRNSSIVTVNAPAIIYPYLRSFISTVTLNTGYLPIVLPTMNFVKFAEKNKMPEFNFE